MAKLNLTDRARLEQWLMSRASLAEVEMTSSIGLVGNVRFTEAARNAFIFIWSWSDQRFSGRAGAAQDRFYGRHGMAALSRRIERVRRVAERYGMPSICR